MYQPGVVPSNPADIPAYLTNELAALSQNLNLAREFLLLKKRNSAPTKLLEGMIVLADGANFNPTGSGVAGYYGYYNSAWHFLG
jgi:hypothetical protein